MGALTADALTKVAVGPLRLLNLFLQKQTWKLIHDPAFESARKRALAGRGILDEPEVATPPKGAEIDLS